MSQVQELLESTQHDLAGLNFSMFTRKQVKRFVWLALVFNSTQHSKRSRRQGKQVSLSHLEQDFKDALLVATFLAVRVDDLAAKMWQMGEAFAVRILGGIPPDQAFVLLQKHPSVGQGSVVSELQDALNNLQEPPRFRKSEADERAAILLVLAGRLQGGTVAIHTEGCGLRHRAARCFLLQTFTYRMRAPKRIYRTCSRHIAAPTRRFTASACAGGNNFGTMRLG